MQQNLCPGAAYIKWFCEKFQVAETEENLHLFAKCVNGRKADSAPGCERLALLWVILRQVVGRAMLQRGKCLALLGFAPETNQSDTPCSALELRTVWGTKGKEEECWPAWCRAVADMFLIPVSPPGSYELLRGDAKWPGFVDLLAP